MRTDFAITEKTWSVVLLALSCTVLLVTVWCLMQGITIIFMHLYYLPILLLAYHYRKTGFWLSVLLSVLYLALVALLVPGDADVFQGAVFRALMFISIAAIVVYLAERRDAREALQKSEEKYRTLFERADDAVIIMNETTFLDCNPAALRMYRCTRDEILGHSPLDFSPEIQPNGQRSDTRVQVKIRAALEGTPQSFYWKHTRQDGTVFDAEVALNSFVLNGQVLLQAMVRDISARKDLERALSESESRLRSFIEATGDSVVIVDEEGKVIEWNPASERITGLRKEETLGRNIWDVTIAMALPEHRTEARRMAIERSMREMLSTGVSIYSEPHTVEALRPDGARFTTRQRIFPIKTPNGFRVASVAQDVTAEKAATAALEESNRRLATLIASLQGMVYRCRNDPDWTLEYVSEGCIPLTGFTPEEFVAKRCVAYGDLIHPDDRQYVWDGVQAAVAAHRPYQLRYRIIHRDGSVHWVGELGRGVFAPDGTLQALEGYNADITGWQNAEVALKKTHDLLNETQALSGLGGWEYDCATQKVTWTEEVYRIHGVGMDFCPSALDPDLQFYPEESRRVIEEAFRRCIEDGVPYDIEADLNRADGRTIRVRTMGSPVTEGGRTVRIHGTIMDITERWRAQEALAESESRLRTFIETTQDAVVLNDETGRITDWNAACERMSGITKEEALGRYVWDISWEMLPPDRKTPALKHHLEQSMREALATGRTGFGQSQVIESVRRDGTRVISSQVMVPMKTKNGFRFGSISRDITAEKLAEQALAESEIRFRQQYQNNPLAIFTWRFQDADFVLTDCNAAAVALTGGRSSQFLGKTASELYASRTGMLSDITRCYTDHVTLTKELVSEHFLPGRIIRTTAAWVPPDLVMVHMEDITDRKEAENAIREKTAFLEAQLQTSLDGTLVVDSNGRKILQNQRLIDLWKIPREIADDPDDSRQVRHVMQMTTDPQGFYEKVRYLYDHPSESSQDIIELTDGTILDRYSAPVLGPDGKNYGRIWKFRDITEHRRAEIALRESEEKFRLVVENAPEVIFIQSGGVFAYLNPAACSMFRVPSPETLLGTPVTDRVHPESRPTISTWIRMLNDERVPVSRKEEKILSSGGVEYDVEVSAIPVVYLGKAGSLVFITDIGERKRAEAEREGLIAELARKNAELDRFTYTVSHDLKSPLIAIRSFIALLDEDLKSGDSSRAVSDIKYISDSAGRLEDLINSLLTLSRSGRTVSTPLPVQLSGVVKAATMLLETVIHDRGVTLTVDPDLPVVMGDRDRLIQVMTNLLDNAVKFMGSQECPVVTVGVVRGQDGPVLFVRDNGSGLKNEDHPRLFGLFERFNPEVPGTGIGLATVRRIIEAHGGRIWAESEGEGKGTTFYFTLPVAEAAGTAG